MIGLLRSWKLWLALALAAGAVSVVAIGLYQARTIGELGADLSTKEAAIDALGYQMGRHHEQHQVAMAARDAALAAERDHAREAQARAEGLAGALQKARATDEQIDTCMALRLPDGIAERLR